MSMKLFFSPLAQILFDIEKNIGDIADANINIITSLKIDSGVRIVCMTVYYLKPITLHMVVSFG